MSTPGDALIQSLQSGYGLGRQMLEARRQNTMRQILSQAYQPPQTQTNNVPQLDAQRNPVTSYISDFQGTGLPIASQNITTQTPGGFDWQKAYQLAGPAGITPEIMQMQSASPEYAIQKMAAEYNLKNQFQQNMIKNFLQQINGGQAGGNNPAGNSAAGMTMGITPQGPTFGYDPFKAIQANNLNQKQGLDEQNFYDTHGYYPPGGYFASQNQPSPQRPQASPPSTMGPPSGAGLAPAQQRAITETSAKTKAEGIAKRELEQPKDITSLEDINSKADTAIDAAKSVLNAPGLDLASGKTWWLGSIPGSGAPYDASQKLNTLKGQIMLSVLQSFRSASANGSSGFGQLSNAEGDVLRNSIANLDRAQSTPELKKALETVINDIQGSKDRMSRGYQRLYGEKPQIKEYHTNPNAPAESQAQPQNQAPQAAIQFLKNNNTPMMRREFQKKYGYLPSG